MSASPRFTFGGNDRESVIGLVPFPAREAAGAKGDWLPVETAAGAIGVSASTLRRALARVRSEAPSGSARLEGAYRDRWFEARHVENGHRRQWQIRFIDRPIDVLSHEAVSRALERVSEFRRGQTADWPEHALDHTPGRWRWWQFWRSA
jgi:hypothetical protein